MLKCGCFDGFRRAAQGGDRPKALPAPLDERALQTGSPEKTSPGITSRFPLEEGELPSRSPSMSSIRDSLSPLALKALDRVAPAIEVNGAPSPEVQAALGVPLKANGFRKRVEIAAIRVSEEYKSPFSLPQEALIYQPPRDQMIADFKNGDSERMIHCNTQLDPEESRQLAELRALAEQRNLAFSPSVSSAATRCLSDARGNVPLALEKMCNSQKWRENFFSSGPITCEMVIEDLSHGMMYFGCRDYALRPTMFIRPSRAPQKYRTEEGAKTLTRLLIFCIEYWLRYMCMPGKVENVCIIVDLKDAGYIPVSVLLGLGRVLGQQHAARVWRFYICNMNWFMKALSKIVQGCMTDRQIEKIRFINEMSVLHKDYALHQLEEDFGGTRAAVTKFFPFPMQVGPFEAGCRTGPDLNAVAGVHAVLTEEGSRGCLWDPALSHEENVMQDYTDAAPELFRRCKYPMPEKRLKEAAPPIFLPTTPSAASRLGAPGSTKAGTSPRPLSVVEEPGPFLQTLSRSPRDDSTHAGESSYDAYRSEDDKLFGRSEDIYAVEHVDICRPRVLSCFLCKCTVGLSKKEKEKQLH